MDEAIFDTGSDRVDDQHERACADDDRGDEQEGSVLFERGLVLLDLLSRGLDLVIAGLQLKDAVLTVVIGDNGSRRVRRDIPHGDRCVLDDGALLVFDRSFDRTKRILRLSVDQWEKYKSKKQNA